MGRRSRKRSAAPNLKTSDVFRKDAPEIGDANIKTSDEFKKPDRYARSRAKDEEVRRELEPLEEGERPGAVTVGAIVCAVLGIGQFVFFLAGVEIQGKKPSLLGIAAFTILMFTCAYGMWRARYWAVLGFEALLGMTIVIAGLSLIVASNVAALILCVAIMGLGGWLFYKLVRAMARIQMPERP